MTPTHLASSLPTTAPRFAMTDPLPTTYPAGTVVVVLDVSRDTGQVAYEGCTDTDGPGRFVMDCARAIRIRIYGEGGIPLVVVDMSTHTPALMPTRRSFAPTRQGYRSPCAGYGA